MIRVVPDVGAPLAVVAVDLLAESFIPDQAEYADYAMTVGGYLAGWMGWGGDFVKNIGISSAPLTARKIYDRIKGGAGASRLAFRRSAVSRYPAPATKTPYEGVRLV